MSVRESGLEKWSKFIERAYSNENLCVHSPPKSAFDEAWAHSSRTASTSSKVIRESSSRRVTS
jgi:hypothetical protein